MAAWGVGCTPALLSLHGAVSQPLVCGGMPIPPMEPPLPTHSSPASGAPPPPSTHHLTRPASTGGQAGAQGVLRDPGAGRVHARKGGALAVHAVAALAVHMCARADRHACACSSLCDCRRFLSRSSAAHGLPCPPGWAGLPAGAAQGQGGRGGAAGLALSRAAERVGRRQLRCRRHRHAAGTCCGAGMSTQPCAALLSWPSGRCAACDCQTRQAVPAFSLPACAQPTPRPSLSTSTETNLPQ